MVDIQVRVVGLAHLGKQLEDCLITRDEPGINHVMKRLREYHSAREISLAALEEAISK